MQRNMIFFGRSVSLEIFFRQMVVTNNIIEYFEIKKKFQAKVDPSGEGRGGGFKIIRIS